MSKLSQIRNFIAPRTIKTVDELKNILSSKHNKQSFLGITHFNKYELPSDVFESFAKDSKRLTVPQNLSLKLLGNGSSEVDLAIEQGAVFKGKKAAFNYVISSGNLIIKEAENLIARHSASGNIKNVKNTAEFIENADMLVDKATNAIIKDSATPLIRNAKFVEVCTENSGITPIIGFAEKVSVKKGSPLVMDADLIEGFGNSTTSALSDCKTILHDNAKIKKVVDENYGI